MDQWFTQAHFLKTNKNKSQSDYLTEIGFHQVTEWKNILTPAPTDSKFVDNAGYEFNAPLSINLTFEKESGGADAAKITLTGYKRFAGGSNGPCN